MVDQETESITLVADQPAAEAAKPIIAAETPASEAMKRPAESEATAPPAEPTPAEDPSAMTRKKRKVVPRRKLAQFNEKQEKIYCICRDVDDGRFMIMCDHCQEW